MPPVRNGPYANVDDRTAAAAAAAAAVAASSLHMSPANHHLINDSKISMHSSHLSMQSPVSASMAISSKQCNQYGSSSSPAMMQQQQQHHHSSGSSQQHTPLTKAELRKVNNANCSIYFTIIYPTRKYKYAHLDAHTCAHVHSANACTSANVSPPQRKINFMFRKNHERKIVLLCFSVNMV